MTSFPAPELSVIIAVFNGGPRLAEQLDALAAQTGAPPFEVIAADNGSNDGSGDLVLTYRERLDVTVVDASAQRGQTFARNVGVGVARADRFAFLDQDDVVDERYIAAMADALTRHDFVGARLETGRLNADWLVTARRPAQTDTLPTTPVPWAYGCTIGIRRSAFDAIGGFDTNLYVSSEDIDFCARAAALGIVLASAPDAVLHYRLAGTCLALLRQGRRYGIGYEFVATKHGFDREPASRWLRMTLGSVRRAVAVDRARRAQGSFLLGRRWGELEGRVRAGLAVRMNWR